MNQQQKEDLRATLDQLRAQLEEFEGGDLDVREKLHEALRDIEIALVQSTEEARSPESASGETSEESIARRLSEVAQHFEVSHPVLSSTLGSVIDALGRMGI